MPVTVDDVIDALRPVEDPELHRSIVDLDMVRDVRIDGDDASPSRSPSPSPGARCATRSRAGSPRRSPRIGVRVRRPVLRRDDRRAAGRRSGRSSTATRPPPPGSQPAHGHAEGRAIPFADPDEHTRVLLIASGKGGVGKSSVTTNLAVALAQRGQERRRHRRRRVGLLDPAHARRRAPARRDRLDARAAHRRRRRALHLDGVLRQGGPAGHLAGPDAPQGARAVPHRRLLGRPRLPARRPAAGHRRHLPVAGPVPAATPRSTSSPRRSRPPSRSPSGPGSWPRR